MKNKIKKISVAACAVCAMVASVCVLGACGSIDYSNYTYENYAAMTDKDWDSKKISYQFVSGNSATDTIDVAVPESHNIYLINFYSDGTMLMWQAGLQLASMKDAAWFDADRHITWGYFGLWETDENGDIDAYYITLATANYADSHDLDPVTVEMNEEWVNVAAYKFHIKATKSGDNYVITQGDGATSEIVWYLGVNLNAENFSIPFTSWTSTSGSAIKYKTLQSFVDMYIGEKSFWTEV